MTVTTPTGRQRAATRDDIRKVLDYARTMSRTGKTKEAADLIVWAGKATRDLKGGAENAYERAAREAGK